jgi:ribosomal protein S18 acetylase RimI-like enzyme
MSLSVVRYDAASEAVTAPNGMPRLTFTVPPLLCRAMESVAVERGDLVPPPGSLDRCSTLYLCLPSPAATSELGDSHGAMPCARCAALPGRLVLVGRLELTANSGSWRPASQSTNAQPQTSGRVAAACICAALDPPAPASASELTAPRGAGRRLAAYAAFNFVFSSGSATLQPVAEVYLTAVTVAADLRRGGLCRALLHVAFDDMLCAAARSVQRVRLHVRSDSTFLRRMYAGFGFVVRRECRGYYRAQRAAMKNDDGGSGEPARSLPMDAVEMVKQVGRPVAVRRERDE